MSSKEKKPKSKSKSKDVSRKDTEKSVKTVKSDKSSKSKSDKSAKKSGDKDNKDKAKSKSKSPKDAKEEKEVEADKQPINNITNTLGNNLTPVKDIANPYDSVNFSSRPQFSPKGNPLLQSNTTGIANAYPNADKCDGCFDAEAVIYCKECEKSFCAFCEGQIHVVPVNRNHERIPITEMNHLKKLCYHHNRSLKFYCDSCDEPICNECQILGPHNTKLHRIANIMDTYKRKYQAMNELIQNQLMKKSELLTSNLLLIDNKINELQLKEKMIEREIKKVYENMLDKLKSEEGKKTAMLNYESATIQKELVQIGEVMNYIKDTNDHADILGFLLRYKQLNENVESLISRQSNFELDSDVINLPNDIEIQKNQIDSFEKMKKLVKVKDDIIWNLLQENNHSQTQVSGNNLASSYGKASTSNTNSHPQPNLELAKSILTKVRKSSINFYQLLCGQEEEIGSQYISRKGLLTAINAIGIPMKEEDIDGLLMALNIKDFTKISIKEAALSLSQLSL